MEFQLSYFKSWKMILWKCWTQYASKFGKLSSGHRTGKCQLSFQLQRKVMPKNAQTTAQLHSSNMIVKCCLKFSKTGCSNTWTINFQMFNLVLEKAEEPEIKLPLIKLPLYHWKMKRVPEKHLSLLYWLCQSLWLCGSQHTVGNSERDGIPDHVTCLLRNLYEVSKQQLEPEMEQQTGFP